MFFLSRYVRYRGLLRADQDQRGQGEQEADLRGPGLTAGV